LTVGSVGFLQVSSSEDIYAVSSGLDYMNELYLSRRLLL